MAKIEKLDGKSMDIIEQNIEQLKELFPSVFSEGKIQFNQLEELLGNYVVEDEDHYSFTWHGKRKAGRLAQTPSTGTLRPCEEESVDWDNTENLFIEGDNLEVLKLLQKSYHRQVKMIYIDPPYNTGNDFVYEDDFKDGVKNYLELTGQLDAQGKKMGTNSNSAGRFHTNWLNMMYPRLKQARNLMRKDGVIFISISDQEIGNLRKLCDDVFGEDNFEGHIHWRRRHNQPNDPTKMIGLVAEHILAYARDSTEYKAAGVGKIGLTGKFSNPDKDSRGDWSSKPWKVGSDQSGSQYKITLPSGKEVDGEWMGEKATYDRLLSDNRIIFPDSGRGSPRKKYFKFEREEEGQCATNWWSHKQFGHNQEGNSTLTELMNDIKNTFSNPKPTKLIDGLISVANCKDGDLILDFFAGSGTTAHAAFKHESDVRSILVQLPEVLKETIKEHRPAIEFCNLNGLNHSLAELTKERVRRAGKKIKEDIPDHDGDIGFRVFKLDKSNIKRWDADFDTLEADLVDAVDYLVEGRSDEDVLYELCLKLGLDLSVKIEKNTVADEKVFILGRGYLVVCLSDNITMDLVNGIGKLKADLSPEDGMRVVFKDDGFKDDVVKTNALQTLKRFGIDDIKSL